jgi:lysozyme family protein
MAKKKLAIPSFESLKDEYAQLWESAVPRVDWAKAIDVTAKQVLANRGRYEYVAAKVGNVPWYIVAAIHILEGSGNFETHLHCGDPLTARTVHVPKGHPRTGKPPFTWEFSACDALRLKNIQLTPGWSKERICYTLEPYNGWGYRWYHPRVLTPYLWSGTSHYVKGKYASDGKWDGSLVSKQVGAVALLKRLQKLDKSITFTDADVPVSEAQPSKVRAIAQKTAEAAKRAGEAAGQGAKSFEWWGKVGTFGALVYSYFSDGMAWAFDGVMSLTNSLPDVTGQVESQLMSAEKVSGWLGIPWAHINLALVVVLSALVIYNVCFKKE